MPGQACSSSMNLRGPSERSCTISGVHFVATISAVAATPTAVWVANYGGTTVTALAPTTGKPIATVAVGTQPVGLAVTPHGLWVVNQGDGTASIVDPATRKVRGTVKIATGAGFAAFGEGGTNMDTFRELYQLWTHDGALEIDVLQSDERRFDFNVVRCKYSEMYRSMGLGELGGILSCNPDGGFFQGYDPRIKLERTQTLMQGSSAAPRRWQVMSRQTSTSTAGGLVRSRMNAGKKLLTSSMRYSGTPLSSASFFSSASGRKPNRFWISRSR